MTTTLERPPHAIRAEASRRAREAFREDYTDLRSWGLDHAQIAERFGIDRASLIRRCDRNGIYIPEEHERNVFTRLDKLIESGVAFTSEALPRAERSAGASALKRAAAAGRIHAIGWMPLNDNKGHRRRLWQSTAAVQAVAS